MVDIEVHRCPRCELRFVSLAELEDHLDRDHHLDLKRPDKTGTSVEPIETLRTSGTVVVPVDPSTGPGAAVALAAQLALQAGMALEVVPLPRAGSPGPRPTAICKLASARPRRPGRRRSRDERCPARTRAQRS